MPELNLQTKAKITWCPGCPDAAILVAFRQAVTEFVQNGELKIEDLVAGAGIGCHGKISDYLNVNTFTSLHGRVIPALTGIKIANPALTVVGFSGDGDSFDEGIEHLVHAARRNSDIKMFIHDNQVFALTTGQVTPTSPKGFKGKTTPYGSVEEPLNPLLMMLAMGATFVARSYAPDIAKTKELMQAAMRHKGFAFLDIIQPCLTFFDTREYFKERVYWMDAKEYPTADREKAMKAVQPTDGRVPLGVFYKTDKPTFEGELWA